MPVSARAIERVLNHWNSKGAPLTRHRSGGTSQFRRIRAALQEAFAAGTSEQTILEALDLYHRCLTDPTLTLHRYRKMAPTKVGLDEFFKFTAESLNMINVYGIEGLKGVSSWFELLKRGEKAMRDRFEIVPEDKFPVVTKLLKKEICSWEDHPSVAGNQAERQLRRAAANLVAFHQRIKGKILTHRKIERASAPYFLQEWLGDFMRDKILNSGRFRLYWLTGERFTNDFEQWLIQVRAIANPAESERVTVRRDKGRSFGGRGGAVDRYRHDNERDISATDFEDL